MRLPLLVLFMLSTAVRAESAVTAEQWLQRMSTAADTQNYQGTLVYSRGKELVTFRLTHVSDNGHEWEHLVQLDGKANEALRGGGDLIYKSPGGASTRLQLQPSASLRPETSMAALNRSRAHYRFTLTGGERIAGRDAVQVTVMPLQPDRYGHVFFIDRQSGLLLRSRLLGSDGAVLETLGFSSLAMGPEVGRAEYQSARRVAAKTSVAAAASVAVPPPWRLQIPEGFVPDAGAWHVRQMNGSRVELVSYGDGFSSFSAFSELLTGPVPSSAQSQYGSTRMVSRVLEANGGKWRLTLVGELPQATLQRIADSAEALKP